MGQAEDMDRFIEAAMPQRWTICGVRLKPFSLGHHLLLWKVGSPFVTATAADAGWGDVLLGLAICSRKFCNAAAMLEACWLPWLVKWYALQVRVRIWWNVLTLTTESEPDRPTDNADRNGPGVKAALFARYVAKGSEGPNFFRKETSRAVDDGISWAHAMLITLTAHRRHTTEEALNMPLSLAKWEYAAYFQENGAIQIKTFTHDRLFKLAEEEKAKLQKATKESEPDRPTDEHGPEIAKRQAPMAEEAAS